MTTSVNKHRLHQLNMALADIGIYLEGVEVDEKRDIVRIGYRSLEATTANGIDEISRIVSACQSGEEQGLNSQLIEVLMFCPSCGEVIMKYQIHPEWLEQYSQNALGWNELMEKVVDTVVRREHS
jgi:hypothetical protein